MFKALPTQRLDQALNRWRELPYVRPRNGWLREIREALGMTTRQLARRVGVSQAAVIDAQRHEADGDITLTTLRRYAAALDCELFYALVPRRSLQGTVEEQAGAVARDEVARRLAAMTPGDQALAGGSSDEEVATLRGRLLAARRSRLWKQP